MRHRRRRLRRNRKRVAILVTEWRRAMPNTTITVRRGLVTATNAGTRVEFYA